MGILKTREQADALCTVIALGFIISSKNDIKKQSYIFYQEGTDGDAEYRRHLQLEKKLEALTGSGDLLKVRRQTSGDKSLM